MSYEISVIIPVYNVEAYIEQCLESVVNQSLGIENIEVIIVNDATEDNSMSIVTEYSEKYPSFKIINNSINKGLGESRNIGLSNATSDYVTFMDSDDFISLNTYEDSLKKLKESNSDLLVYNWEAYFEDNRTEAKSIHNQNTDRNRILNSIADFPEIFLSTSAWNKIYHRSLFNFLNYRKGLYEDNIVTSLIFLNAKKIYLSKDSTYYYRRNTSSITENIEIENLIDLAGSVKLLFNLKSDYPNYFTQVKLLIIKFVNDILFFLFNNSWSLKEEFLILDTLKQSLGEITKEDLVYFKELFPQYTTLYMEESLDLSTLPTELFLAKYKYFNRLSKVKSIASLYIDDGDGFREDLKIDAEYTPDKNNKLSFDLSKFPKILNLRFDPLEGSFIKSKINNVDVLDANCDNSPTDEYQIFLTTDPSYIIQTDVKSSLTVDFDLEFLGNDEIAGLFSEKNNVINELRNKSNHRRFKFLK